MFKHMWNSYITQNKAILYLKLYEFYLYLIWEILKPNITDKEPSHMLSKTESDNITTSGHKKYTEKYRKKRKLVNEGSVQGTNERG